jgi:transcription elongation factor GreB
MPKNGSDNGNTQQDPVGRGAKRADSSAVSKAFTREENQGPDLPEPLPTSSVLPPGAKNYITRAGADRLREELERLAQRDRPRLAAERNDPEAKRQLARIDQRIFQIEQSLETAEVVSDRRGPAETVTFGATVRLREEDGQEVIYRIVGVDEVDVEQGWISWFSPIARALMNAKSGQHVSFKSPAGEQDLEILAVHYE